MSHIYQLMEHTASPLKETLNELKNAAAAQAARDSVISNLVLLFLNHLIRLFSSLETVFQAWRDGTLPPLPQPRTPKIRQARKPRVRAAARIRARRRRVVPLAPAQTRRAPQSHPVQRQPRARAGQNPRPRAKIPILRLA